MEAFFKRFFNNQIQLFTTLPISIFFYRPPPITKTKMMPRMKKSRYQKSNSSFLLGLLANSGPLAAKDGGCPLHGGALLGLVEGADAVGDRLDDGAATLLQSDRGCALGGGVDRWR